MLFGTEVCRILDSAKEQTKWEKVSEQEFITVRIMIKIIVFFIISDSDSIYCYGRNVGCSTL